MNSPEEDIEIANTLLSVLQIIKCISFPLIYCLLDFDHSFLQVSHHLQIKNLAAREENKMSRTFTKNPFYMSTMESFCEWLTSLSSCTGDYPFSFLSLLLFPTHSSAQSCWLSRCKYKGELILQATQNSVPTLP